MNMRMLKKFLPGSRWAVISVPYVWLLLFFAIPFLIVLKISFAKLAIAQPPYTPILQVVQDEVLLKLNLTNYMVLFSDSQYLLAYASSLKIAAISTLGPSWISKRSLSSDLKSRCSPRTRANR